MIDTECYDANVFDDNEFVILNDAECAEYECDACEYDDNNNDFINENVTENNAIRNECECTDNIFTNNDFIYDTLSVCMLY